MTTLETIATASLVTAIATLSIAGVMTYGIAYYLSNYNYSKQNKFLKKELGKNSLKNVKLGHPVNNPNKKDEILIPVKYNEQDYTLILKPKKTTWLADQFYDIKLYDPVRLNINKV